ncbi:MAG: YceI family protein [Rhodospirillaceae bacterium]|nr:YceI family protein [Rhodospirillaceae bacterium]MDD9996942.1 YceI family protein [Rhodospirillaceae bacterium]MDE0360714.1 YceI family protein [Rhodospirillaceae bacterium]
MKRIALFTAGALLASGGAYGQAPLWTVEADSYLGYELLFAGNDVNGEFTGFDARIQFDPEMLDTSRFLVVVDLQFIETRDEDHATALRGREFFEIDVFPESRFEATEFQHIAGNQFEGTGQLTIRDRTLPLVLPFTFDTSEAGATLAGEVVISRLEYGVGKGDWQLTDWMDEFVTVRYQLLLSQ